jgi:hypothetical protein
MIKGLWVLLNGFGLLDKKMTEAPYRMKYTLLVVFMGLSFLINQGPVQAFGVPLTRIEESWFPAEAENIRVAGIRVSVVPSIDSDSGEHLWLIDETMLVKNTLEEPFTFHLAAPNMWSAEGRTDLEEPQDFWTEAFVNGQQVETHLIELAPNPQHYEVNYRSARRFHVTMRPSEAIHVRLRFAIPQETHESGEIGLNLPFGLRRLWDGTIDFGLITVRWSAPMFAFRTNLPTYALYRDRVEWFLREFSPEEDIEMRFLSHHGALSILIRGLNCPQPWLLLSHVEAGDTGAIEELLELYSGENLLSCAALPSVLYGSLEDARQAGLELMRFESFSEPESNITGPIFWPDPEFSIDKLSEAERIYRQFLLQNLEQRNLPGQ